MHVLVYEPVLRLPVGGVDVLAAQLRHLLEMLRRPEIAVRVVRVAAGPHAGLEGPFMILDSVSYQTVVHLENRVLSIFLEEETHIESYRLAWKAILTRSLSPQRSAELIAHVAAEVARQAEERT